jgi:hypothetical protein
VERDVSLITYHPAIVTGGAGRNIEESAGGKFANGAAFDGRSRTAGKCQAHVLDVAARGTHAGADVDGPSPAGLIGGAADGEAANPNDFEFSFIEGSDFIGLIKSLQNDVAHRGFLF